MLKILFFYFFCSIFIVIHAANVGSETGYKIPRFVSLKSDDSNLRIGSSKNYPIILKYKLADMPIEIIEEYKNWRKVKDHKGNQGWLHKSLIKGDRFAIILPIYDASIQIHNKPMGKFIGKIGKNNIVKLNTCFDNWCSISFQNKKGWVTKNNLWGVYQDEEINVPFYQPLKSLIWKIKF